MPAFKRIDVGTLKLAFLDEGVGPAIVALHGFPDSWRSFDATARSLVEAGYRVVRPALRGYAPSGIPRDRRYDTASLSDDILRLIDGLDLEKAVVLGHDWGASIAYDLAGRAPERLLAIVTLAVPPPATAVRGWREWLARPHNLTLGLGPLSDWQLRRHDFAELRRLYRLWSPNWFGNERHIETVIGDLRPDERSRAAVGYYQLSLRTGPKSVDLPTMPSLLIYGSDEPPVRREGFERAVHRLPEPSRVLRIEGAGHWPHLEAPETVRREILRFLRFIELRRPQGFTGRSAELEN